MNPVHVTTQANLHGRDFVVGDLHGSYNLLMQFFEHVKFDDKADRLFSVGDLVDRGPFNMECLALLEQPWFFANYGNHEDLMVAYLEKQPMGAWWFQNGGIWYAALDAIDQKYLHTFVLPLIKQLPLVRTVLMSNDKRFHIVHAELMSDVPLTDEDFQIDGMLDNPCTEQSSDGDTAIWGRNFFGAIYGMDLSKNEHEVKKWARGLSMNRYFRLFNDKLSTIFSGHSVMQRPTKLGGQINLDTCAYSAAKGFDNKRAWCGLTVCEPLTNTFWTTNFEGTKEVECVVV